MSFSFNALVPELSVSHLGDSLRFYVDILGFSIEYTRPEVRFAFLSFEGSQIMLEEVNNTWSVGNLEKPFGRGVNFQFTVSDVRLLLSRLRAAGLPLFKELHRAEYLADTVPYACEQFLVQDPDGYLLRFSQDI